MYSVIKKKLPMQPEEIIEIIVMKYLIIKGASGKDGAQGRAGSAGAPGERGDDGEAGEPGAAGPPVSTHDVIKPS